MLAESQAWEELIESAREHSRRTRNRARVGAVKYTDDGTFTWSILCPVDANCGICNWRKRETTAK